MKVKLMQKKRKNGVILFDNSTIQNLHLKPEDFGTKKIKIFIEDIFQTLLMVKKV